MHGEGPRRTIPEVLRELADLIEAQSELAPARPTRPAANDQAAAAKPARRRRGARVAPPPPAVELSETDRAYGRSLLRRLGRGG